MFRYSDLRLGYSLEFADNLSLSVGGFNDKLPELMQVTVERVAKVLEELEAAGENLKDADLLCDTRFLIKLQPVIKIA